MGDLRVQPQPDSHLDLQDGYKNSEIGTFPQEWQIVRLENLFEIQQGKALSKKSRMGVSPRPFLRTANVLWNKVDLTTLDMMDFTGNEAAKLSLLPGDLLVCEGGDIGRTAIWHGEIEGCCYQNHVHRLRTSRPDVEPRFYMFWMQAALRLLGLYEGAGNKTTIPNLSKARLGSFSVPLPSPSEQRAIAHVLRTIQKAIETTEQVIEASQELKRSLMNHLFTYGSVPVDEAEQVPLKETEIGPVAEHWKVVELRGITTRGKQLNPTKTPDRMFNYIDVSSVSRESLSVQDYTEYEGRDAPSRARKLVKSGDTIFATVRPSLKRVAKIPAELDSYICSTAFCVIRANTELADPGFIFFAASADSFVERVSEHQRGSSYPAVADRDVLDELIPLPPLNEQRDISRMLRTADEKIAAEVRRKQSLGVLFKTFLHDLMTGKVIVDDLDLSAVEETI